MRPIFPMLISMVMGFSPTVSLLLPIIFKPAMGAPPLKEQDRLRSGSGSVGGGPLFQSADFLTLGEQNDLLEGKNDPNKVLEGSQGAFLKNLFSPQGDQGAEAGGFDVLGLQLPEIYQSAYALGSLGHWDELTAMLLASLEVFPGEQLGGSSGGAQLDDLSVASKGGGSPFQVDNEGAALPGSNNKAQKGGRRLRMRQERRDGQRDWIKKLKAPYKSKTSYEHSVERLLMLVPEAKMILRAHGIQLPDDPQTYLIQNKQITFL